MICTREYHYSCLGLKEEDLRCLPTVNVSIIEVGMSPFYQGKMVAASRFEGSSIPVVAKALNCDLKTAHLYVRMGMDRDL